MDYETLLKKYNRLKDIYKQSVILRLKKIEGVKNTLPEGTEISICDTNEDLPRVTGIVSHETSKFYVINGKRYHKRNLKFYDLDGDGKVILEDTTW